MTATDQSQAPAKPDLVTATIDGVEVSVPKGTLIIRAAERVGIAIPRFCDHPLLKPAGACRQCLVDVATPDREGNIKPMPKPQASCTMEITPGMEVSTQRTSAVAEKAQRGIMEFLLINHPLDCPVCDKGGECPLQNQALANGQADSRFTDVKRTFPKPIKVSTQILLDRDRCILCQRCTRFSTQIAGDPFIALQGRGGGTPAYGVHGLHGSQVGAFDESILDFAPDGAEHVPGPAPLVADVTGPQGAPGLAALAQGPVGVAELDESGRVFTSYFSGNTIQICPVGALTSASYRFRARPFDLVSTDSVAEHDASGSAIRVDHRRGVVVRRLAGEDALVNEEWITDKDRFAYRWQTASDRLDVPLVRDEVTGELVRTSWSEALDIAATKLAEAGPRVGLLPGGRLTLEDAHAWGRFARDVLGTNDIDARARVSTAEEEAFLAHRVAGSGLGVTYTQLEKAGQVLLVGLEPEEECGTIFLRLRKGVLAGTVRVATVAPLASRGTTKLRGRLVPSAPGTEPEVLDAIGPASHEPGLAALAEALHEPGAVILVGERAAAVPGTLSAVEALASRTGARVAWVPRRAGERAAVDAGLLPGLLPGGRLASDAAARADVAAVWGAASLPSAAGRDLPGILDAARHGGLAALVVGGIDLRDLPDPDAARDALRAAGFVVQLEVRRSEVTEFADVVLPVAPVHEKPGTFLNWEGRLRPFGQVLVSRARSDRQVLARLTEEMGRDLGVDDLAALHTTIGELDGWDGARGDAPRSPADALPAPAAGEAVLATWRLMLDDARGQDGEPHLAGTAHRAVARISADTAAEVGVAEGGLLTVATDRGRITVPVVTASMPDHVVWLPTLSGASHVHEYLGVTAGEVVRLSAATDTAPVGARTDQSRSTDTPEVAR